MISEVVVNKKELQKSIEEQKKIRGPNYNCKIGKLDDGYELGIYRDKIGNATFAFWKSGQGFRDEVNVNPRDLKKLREWIDKLIQFTDRP